MLSAAVMLSTVRGLDSLSGQVTLTKLFCLPSEKGFSVSLHTKPLLKGGYSWCAEKQMGSHKNCFPCKKMMKTLPNVSRFLNTAFEKIVCFLYVDNIQCFCIRHTAVG